MIADAILFLDAPSQIRAIRRADKDALRDLHNAAGIDDIDPPGRWLPCRCETLLEWLTEVECNVSKDEWVQLVAAPQRRHANLVCEWLRAPRPGRQWNPFPCECVRQMEWPAPRDYRPHYLPYEAQIALLGRLLPGDYREPPKPRRASKVTTQAEKLEVMRKRAERGNGLYHAGDYFARTKLAEAIAENLGRLTGHARNGQLRVLAIDEESTMLDPAKLAAIRSAERQARASMDLYLMREFTTTVEKKLASVRSAGRKLVKARPDLAELVCQVNEMLDGALALATGATVIARTGESRTRAA